MTRQAAHKPYSGTARLRTALLAGDEYTRIEACEAFGISDSTFRWAVREMRAAGIAVTYREVRGRRNALTRRWRVDPS